MIYETALAYANSGIDSYLHIDNYMSINKRKFKPNARFIFAESLLLNEEDANPQQQRQGIARTWGQAFQDFMGGGFSGLTKGKADIERNYKLAIQNLEQMLNLLDQYPSSTTTEVLNTLKQSIENSVKELQSKQELIKNTSDRMKALAMDKSRGEAPRDFKIKNMNDLAQIPLDKLDIYTAIMNSPELAYYFSKQKLYSLEEIESSIQENENKTKYKTFYNEYISKFYAPNKEVFEAKKIPPDIINTYIFLSNRISDITGNTTSNTTKNAINSREDLKYFLEALITKSKSKKDTPININIGRYKSDLTLGNFVNYLIRLAQPEGNFAYLRPCFEPLIKIVNNNAGNEFIKIIKFIYEDSFKKTQRYLKSIKSKLNSFAPPAQDRLDKFMKANSFDEISKDSSYSSYMVFIENYIENMNYNGLDSDDLSTE